ncbi:MAG: hypothetical protein IKE10_00145 [Bacilli bacterium]|nr:hypothetical protein [Bacilli bacterium]
MRKIINILLYVLTIIFLVLSLKENPYINDLYNKKEIVSKKTFNKYYNKQRFVCIDLKDSEMTRFKEEKTDSIVYISSYGDTNFMSVLTKGTSLSDKVCGIIKNKDSMSNELTKSIEEENDIKLNSRYFTNYNLKKEKLPYQVLAISMVVLIGFFILGIIANIVSIIRKEF